MSIEGTVNSIELNQQSGNEWVFVGLVFTNYGNKTFMLEIECFNDKYSVSNAKVLWIDNLISTQSSLTIVGFFVCGRMGRFG